MRILFRVDSGMHIGSGHLMRSMRLATELAKFGHEIAFLCRNHFGSSIDYVSEKFPCTFFPSGVAENDQIDSSDYASWLGCSMEQEINDFRNFLNLNSPFDLLVVDHYALDSQFEQEFCDGRVIVIDDLMNRTHSCDLLIDQNLTADKEKYSSLVDSEECSFLMGPKFAMIDPSFNHFRSKVTAFGSFSACAIFFGGSDITGESRKVVDAISASESKLSFRFIISDNHPDYGYIADKAAIDSRVSLLSFVPEMAQFLSECDLCFGASGASVWERACLGIPSCIVSVADNQIELSKKLQKNQIAYLVGDGRCTSANDWLNIIDSASIKENFSIMKHNGMECCDGLGLFRVVEHIRNKYEC